MKDANRKNLAESLGRARHSQRLAVRWLMDARRFKENFSASESWKADDLSVASELIYNDAIREVIRLADEVDLK